MEKVIIDTAQGIVSEANRLISNGGLQTERRALNLIRIASFLIWNNASMESEEHLVHWITDIELSFMDRIVKLHEERIKQYLNSGRW